MNRHVKAYIFVNGAIYALILLGHLLRVYLEGLAPLANAVFLMSSLVAGGGACWSAVLYARLR